MFCPKCGKEMKIMALLDITVLQDGSEQTEALGRCEDCDFDATWEATIDTDGHIEEFNFKQYFFG